MRRRKIQAAPRGHGIIARRLSGCSTLRKEDIFTVRDILDVPALVTTG